MFIIQFHASCGQRKQHNTRGRRAPAGAAACSSGGLALADPGIISVCVFEGHFCFVGFFSFLVRFWSSVFPDVGVHHWLHLVEGVFAARVVQLGVYHRAHRWLHVGGGAPVHLHAPSSYLQWPRGTAAPGHLRI